MILSIVISSSVFAAVYSYNEDDTVIGFVRTYIVKDSKSLIEIARKFGLGYNEIVSANPHLNPFFFGDNVTVKIPTSWILPNVDLSDGIVINLSEKRLYYFFEQGGSTLVKTFPIGIGIDSTDTPLGNFRITEKRINPSWHVPESIRKRRPYLPRVVPPGRNNPLGSHVLRLSTSNYLIHGTNRPWSIGRRVTSGCIRLYPEDIVRLFQIVRSGTNVTIVQQPVKIGIRNYKVYVEIHRDDLQGNINYFNKAVELLTKKNLLKKINTEKLHLAVRKNNGIPIVISN